MRGHVGESISVKCSLPKIQIAHGLCPVGCEICFIAARKKCAKDFLGFFRSGRLDVRECNGDCDSDPCCVPVTQYSTIVPDPSCGSAVLRDIAYADPFEECCVQKTCSDHFTCNSGIIKDVPCEGECYVGTCCDGEIRK